MNKKIGIISGTFDPIHNGHIRFALEAIDQCHLDKVFFLPEPRPRRKQGVKALKHRSAMIKLAIDSYPKLSMILLKQARFTAYNTLPVLQARFEGADIYMLMGEDMLDHLIDWPNVKKLVDSVYFVIGLRKKSAADIDAMIGNLSKTRGLTFRYKVFHTTESSSASGIIRQKLRRGQEPRNINKDVLRYIHKYDLYSSSVE